MTKLTLDASMCRLKTTVTASINGDGNIDISVATLCPDIVKLLHILPQNIDPNLVLKLKTNVLPECIFTCTTVPGAGCPFICVAYRAVENEARLATQQA